MRPGSLWDCSYVAAACQRGAAPNRGVQRAGGEGGWLPGQG